MQQFTYYKVPEKCIDYMGIRFFRYREMDDQVVQICVYLGKKKKGRPNNIGITLISRATFLGNYKARDVIECSSAEYHKNFISIATKLMDR